jgi:hypothetical protein
LRNSDITTIAICEATNGRASFVNVTITIFIFGARNAKFRRRINSTYTSDHWGRTGAIASEITKSAFSDIRNAARTC